MSALVWPGAGQYAQKRWLAGTFYAVVFLAGVVFLFVSVLTPLFRMLYALADFSGRSEEFLAVQPSLRNILLSFGFLFLVYLGGLLDTIIYCRRRERDGI